MDKLYERIWLAVTIIARLLRNGVPLIAEGIGLYPKLVEQVTSPQQVVYFIADEGLARKTWTDRYENTPWLEGYSEPEQIIEMFINLTVLNARYIQESTQRLGFTCVVSTVESNILDAFRVAEKRFESAIACR
jgi:2-phosphoglycerate kinase